MAPHADTRQVRGDPRTAIILVTLGLLAAVLTAVAIGAQPSTRPDLAPLFGLAGNGRVFSIQDDDIYVTDPGTDTPRPFIESPLIELAPTVTNDGSNIIYERKDGDASTFMIAAADGSSEPRALTPQPFTSIRDWWPSADGRFVAVVSPEGAVDNLAVIRTDDGTVRPLPLGIAATTVSWSPDGERFLVTAKSASATDMYLVPVNGEAPTLLRSGGKDDFQWLWYSPDGQRIAYSSAAPEARYGKSMRVFVANADGTDERVMEVLATSDFEMGGFWSPDGTRLVINVGSGNPHTLAIVSVDGDDPPVMSSPFYGTEGLYMVWAPDGKSVLVYRDPDGGIALVDATTGETTTLPWKSTDWPWWQRLAP